MIGTLSNGNVALLVNMAKRAGLPWDMIFSAELVRQYKSAPENNAMLAPAAIESEQRSEHAKLDAEYAVRLAQVQQSLEEIHRRRSAAARCVGAPAA